MTAPGQEPDEVLTAQPVSKQPDADLNAIGDNHMPEDVRRAEREKREAAADDDAPTDSEEPGADDAG